MGTKAEDEGMPSSPSPAKEEDPEAAHTEEVHDSSLDNSSAGSGTEDVAIASQQGGTDQPEPGQGSTSTNDKPNSTDNGDTGNAAGNGPTSSTEDNSAPTPGQSAEGSPRRKLLKKAPTHFFSARPVGLPYVTAPYRPKYPASPSSKHTGSPKKQGPKPAHDPAPHPNDLTPDEYDLYEPPPTTKTGEGEEDSSEEGDDTGAVEPAASASPKKKTTNQKLMTKTGARPAPKYSKKGPTGNVRADPSKKKYFSPINDSLLKPLSSTPRNRKVWSLDIPIVRQREKDEMEKTLTRVSDMSMASASSANVHTLE